MSHEKGTTKKNGKTIVSSVKILQNIYFVQMETKKSVIRSCNY